MRVSGSTALAARPKDVWKRLSDPRSLADALQAVESVELLDGNAFSVLLEPATGVGVTPLALEISIADRRENEFVRLVGNGRGGEYSTRFAIELEFAPSEDASGTAVRWTADARFDGVLSSLGQRILPAVLAGQVQRVLSAAGRER